MKPRRRSMQQWIADFLRAANLARDRRVYDAGYAAGCLDTKKQQTDSMPPVFGERPVYIPVASVQFFAPPPPQFRTWEPPEKQTGLIRPVQSPHSQQLTEHFGPGVTQSLPAYPGAWLDKALEHDKPIASPHRLIRMWQHGEQQRKTGKLAE